MPRSARLDAPGIFHHVIIRGIERRNIFRVANDRKDFLDRLGNLLIESKTACYGWSLLSNHAHFLFRTAEMPLAQLMRRLLTGYVVNFNQRHKRHGQLLHHRYKSIVCQEDVYLKELVRYIHLNPLRAGVIPTIEDLNMHPYCGHGAIMGLQERAWQEVDYVLGYFGRTITEGRCAYLCYMQEGLHQGRRDELVGGGLKRSLGRWSAVKKAGSGGAIHMMSDERILGESDFVDAILSRANEKYARGYELTIRGYDLQKIATRVAEVCGIEQCEIFSGGQQQNKVKARSILCFWAAKELGLSLADLARILGMSVAGVSYAVMRGQAIVDACKYRLME